MRSSSRVVLRPALLGRWVVLLSLALGPRAAVAQNIDSPAVTSPQSSEVPLGPPQTQVPAVPRSPDPFHGGYSALALQIKTHRIGLPEKDVSGLKWPGAEIEATTYALRLEGGVALEAGVSTVKAPIRDTATNAFVWTTRSPATLGFSVMTGSFMLYQAPETTFRAGILFPEIAARFISNLDDFSLLMFSATLPAVRLTFWRAVLDLRFGEVALDVQFADFPKSAQNSETTSESRSKVAFVAAWELRIGILY